MLVYYITALIAKMSEASLCSSYYFCCRSVTSGFDNQISHTNTMQPLNNSRGNFSKNGVGLLTHKVLINFAKMSSALLKLHNNKSKRFDLGWV